MWGVISSYFWPLIGTNLRAKGLEMDPKDQTVIFGEAFDPFKEDYAIIEFFSTGCPPCRRAVPGLNELQKECPNVKILQISTQTPQTVVQFFQENIRERIHFTVACVSEEDWSKVGYEINLMFIPRALVLSHGVIHYIGHPASSELEEIVRELQKEYNANNRTTDPTDTNSKSDFKTAADTDNLL